MFLFVNFAATACQLVLSMASAKTTWLSVVKRVNAFQVTELSTCRFAAASRPLPLGQKKRENEKPFPDLECGLLPKTSTQNKCLIDSGKGSQSHKLSIII